MLITVYLLFIVFFPLFTQVTLSLAFSHSSCVLVLIDYSTGKNKLSHRIERNVHTNLLSFLIKQLIINLYESFHVRMKNKDREGCILQFWDTIDNRLFESFIRKSVLLIRCL